MEKFRELGLDENILKAIEKMGIDEPSDIQEKAIPVLMDGKDMIGQAQTGTGKTLAFGAPILSKISSDRGKIKAIVLAPTRELAIQVNDELNRIAKFKDTRVTAVYGGSSIENQIRIIRSGVDIVVGTPGRVLDLIKRKIIKLDNIEFLVLDEADEMLNMGFIDDIELIISKCNIDRQTMLFSATMPDRIKKLAKRYMREELEHIKVTKKSVTTSNVTQFYFYTKPENRIETLYRVLDLYSPEFTIIFCNTKKEVDELVINLQNRNYSVEGMHGDMTQHFRMRTMNNFRSGRIKILVATDVAARGIDVSHISHVINYGLPFETESYVHRIGRTGRANRLGEAFTILTPKEKGKLIQIMKTMNCDIVKKPIPTITDIFEVKSSKIMKDVSKKVKADDNEIFKEMAKELISEIDPVEIVASMLKDKYKREISYGVNKDRLEEAKDGRNRNDRNRGNRKGKDRRRKGSVRVFLNLGKKDGLTKKKLLDFCREKANIQGRFITDIVLMDKFSFFYIDEKEYDKLRKNLNKKKFCNRTVSIERAKDRN
ncbi:MAG: DEAD/DEAH box helicase [Andreesenia angusta]|nr:DEAD/DEAH box helicase [Andreesenia angusta]